MSASAGRSRTNLRHHHPRSDFVVHLSRSAQLLRGFAGRADRNIRGIFTFPQGQDAAHKDSLTAALILLAVSPKAKRARGRLANRVLREDPLCSGTRPPEIRPYLSALAFNHPRNHEQSLKLRMGHPPPQTGRATKYGNCPKPTLSLFCLTAFTSTVPAPQFTTGPPRTHG